MKTRLAMCVLALLALTACGGGPRDEPMSGSPSNRLGGAVVVYQPAGCGMCAPNYKPTTYRFFADGRVTIEHRTSTGASTSGHLSADTLAELESRARRAGLAAGDARRWYPRGVMDLGSAFLQVGLDGRVSTREYAEKDGYHLIGYGDWLQRVGDSAAPG